MHYLILLSLLCCALGSVSAAECTGKCEERYEQMQALRSSSSSDIITLSNSLYQELIRGTPRNYSVVLMLNALSPRHQCVHCKQAAEDFEIIAQQFYASYPERNDLFFASADYDACQEVFSALRCTTAPVIYHVMERKAPKQCATRAVDGASISACLREHGAFIKFTKPLDKTKAVLTLLIVAVVIMAIVIFRNTFLRFFTSTLLAQLAIVFSCAMMAGTMWVQIRGAPYLTANKDGSPKWFGDGTQMMYGIESHIVTALMAMTSFSIILLVDTVGPARNIFGTLFGVLLVSVLFSILYKVYALKFHGYPFRFLF